jgi:hypothetical protein
MKLVQFPRSRSRSTLRLTIASVWPLAYLLPPQSPLIASEPLAKGIQDNSFFIEEAYNANAFLATNYATNYTCC